MARLIVWFCKFFIKNFSSKMFLWTQKMHFSQTCSKNLLWNCRVFHSKPRKIKSWYFSQKKFTPTMFLWNRKMQFWQFRRKGFTGRMTIFAQTHKKCRLHLFLKMCPPKMILCSKRMSFQLSRLKDVAIKTRSFCSMSEKIKN